jgi:hypothetical protein
MVGTADTRVDGGGEWYVRVARSQEILPIPSDMHIHMHISTSR